MSGRRWVVALASTLLAVTPGTSPVPAQQLDDTAWMVPVEFARRRSPVPSTTDAITRGRELFLFVCAQCHGRTGRGDGLQASGLRARPADLASARVQSQSDGALFWKIQSGRGEMPKATVDDSKVWLVIAYIRTLEPRSRR